MAHDTQKNVHDILSQLRSLDKARELFAELNYDTSHSQLNREDWSHAAASVLAEDPQIIASHDDFKIIYARLNSDRLLLGDERPVVNRLLRDYPYLLCLFSDRQQQQWHFVNIKYDADAEKDTKRRRLFRRITVGPDERLRTASERLAKINLAELSLGLFDLPPLSIQARHDEAF
ncbi:MAG: class I SAM-dependent DNA methyltransferase, partial [Dehalococcoidia bacterium]|nr:class I SAM-dependent DNA methyltransferase [Dehalococcoidia bacterium]